VQIAQRAAVRHEPWPSALVQHLDPKHDSQLAGLLEKATQMPVCEAMDGLIFAAEIGSTSMPSNVLMTVASGRFGPRAARECDAGRSIAFLALACGGSRRTGGGRDSVWNGRGRNSRCRSREDCWWHYLRGGFHQRAVFPRWAGECRRERICGLRSFARKDRNRTGPASLAIRGSSGWPPIEEETGTEESGAMQARILRLLSARVGVDFYALQEVHAAQANRTPHGTDAAFTNEVHYLRLLEKESMEVERAFFRDALIHVTSFFRDPGAVFQTLQERVAAGDRQTQAAR